MLRPISAAREGGCCSRLSAHRRHRRANQHGHTEKQKTSAHEGNHSSVPHHNPPTYEIEPRRTTDAIRAATQARRATGDVGRPSHSSRFVARPPLRADSQKTVRKRSRSVQQLVAGTMRQPGHRRGWLRRPRDRDRAVPAATGGKEAYQHRDTKPNAQSPHGSSCPVRARPSRHPWGDELAAMSQSRSCSLRAATSRQRCRAPARATWR